MADQTPKSTGDEIGPIKRTDEGALDRAWSRITPADIARSKARLQALKAAKKQPKHNKQQESR